MFIRSFLFLFLLTSNVLADIGAVVVRPSDFDHVMQLISAAVKGGPVNDSITQVDLSRDVVTFISRQPLKFKKDKLTADDFFTVRTQFFLKSSTVEKRVLINQGSEEEARLRFFLKHQGEAYQQFLYYGLGVPMQIYNSAGDMFVYFQAVGTNGEIGMREWIYARYPNSRQGSRYSWLVKSQEFYRRLVLEPGEKGEVDIKRQVVIKEVDANDYAKQRHIIDVVKRLGIKNFHIKGEDTLGKIQPVYYVTKEGIRKSAMMRIDGHDELTIEIDEPPEQYPLLIESS